MTFKVTIWNENQSTGIVRDYRKPVWVSGPPNYQCHGMSRINFGTESSRPYFIEFEGDVSDEIIYRWALPALNPKACKKNITVNGNPIP